MFEDARGETRLEKIKRENEIATRVMYPLDEEPEWQALKVSKFGVCSGLGDTEADAVFNLCVKMQIPCVL